MIEPEKQKNRPLRRRWWRGLLLIPVAAFLGVVALALYGMFALGDYIKPFLNAALAPTAEYLLQHPEPETEYVRLSVIGKGEDGSICVHYAISTANPEKLEIYLNGERANFPWSIFVGMMGLSQSPELHHGNRCTFEKLNPGIHLLEVHLSPVPDQLEAVHRWAFVIEK